MNQITSTALALLCASAFSCSTLTAQDTNISLIHSHADWARIETNPAYIPTTAKSVLSLPLFSGGSFSLQSPASISDIVTKGATSNTIYLDKALREIGGSPLKSNMYINLLGAGTLQNDAFFTLQAGIHSDMNILVDRALSDFLARGNMGSLGTEVKTQGIAVDAQSYIQIALGYAQRLMGGKINFGLRIKALSGLTSSKTLDSRLDIYTSPGADRAVINSLQRVAFTAPIVIPRDGEGVLHLGSVAYDSQRLPSAFENSGWGLDLGIDVQISERLRLGASLTDLGYIDWKGSTQTLTSDLTGDNAVVYDGYDFTPDITGNSGGSKNNLEALSKQIEKSLQLGGETSYRTHLPTHLRLIASYQAMSWLSVSGVVSGRSLFGKTYMQYALVGHAQPTRGLGASASISTDQGTGTSLGAALVLGHSIQLVLAADVMMLSSYTSATNAAFRGGINFRF